MKLLTALLLLFVTASGTLHFWQFQRERELRARFADYVTKEEHRADYNGHDSQIQTMTETVSNIQPILTELEWVNDELHGITQFLGASETLSSTPVDSRPIDFRALELAAMKAAAHGESSLQRTAWMEFWELQGVPEEAKELLWKAINGDADAVKEMDRRGVAHQYSPTEMATLKRAVVGDGRRRLVEAMLQKRRTFTRPAEQDVDGN